MQLANWCAVRKITNGAENLVLQVLQFHQMDICRKLQVGQA
jgi:hypothetical protein